jgi:hypothetical protein
MPRNEELTTFVRDALTRGVPRAEIEAVLTQSGWSRSQAREALAAFAEVPFAIPVPRPRAYTAAREAFLYGILFVAMYVAAFNLGALAFAVIERAFPEGVRIIGLRETARGPLAAVAAALPVFIYASRLTARDIRMDPGKRVSEIRNKLTYLTLFISAAVMIGVGAGLIYGLLGGELTVRFGLKAFTAAVIAAGIFRYYLVDIRAAGADAQ